MKSKDIVFHIYIYEDGMLPEASNHNSSSIFCTLSPCKDFYFLKTEIYYKFNLIFKILENNFSTNKNTGNFYLF